MDLVNDLFKYNNIFIKYMDEAKLYEEDFENLNKYRAIKELTKEYNIKDPCAIRSIMQMWKLDPYAIERLCDKDIDGIVNELRRNVVKRYLEE